MNRYLAVLLVLALPQMASAESVSFGAKLDNDGGHAGGNASGNGLLTGRISWDGNAVTVESGFITGPNVWLEGTVTRSNDPSLFGQKVTVYANPGLNFVILSVPGLNRSHQGYGHVTVR
jgi:hypothetical protein